MDRQTNDEGLMINQAMADQIASRGLINTQGDPRYPANNPLNGLGLAPQPVGRTTYYGDTQIPDVIPGAMPLGGINQLVMQPRGLNQPGNPQLELAPQLADQLGAISGSTMPIDLGPQSPLSGLGTDTSKVGGFNRNQRRRPS